MTNQTEINMLRLSLKLQIYESTGDSFQKLFEKIMGHRFPRLFKSVKAYSGDGGNDGWIPSDGRFYQVYGPSPITDFNTIVNYAKNKLYVDFQKLLTNWTFEPIKHYHFVMNDRFEGIPPKVSQKMFEIKNDFKLKSATSFGAQELESYFLELSEEDKTSIVGYYPLDKPISEKQDCMGRILRYLVQQNTELSSLPQSVEAVELEKKIKFNDFSEMMKLRIKTNNYYSAEIDRYLECNPGEAQQIAQQLSDFYRDSFKNIPKKTPKDKKSTSDLRYFWLCEKIAPIEKLDLPCDTLHRTACLNAAEKILAKYFESCDIYERPILDNSKQTSSL